MKNEQEKGEDATVLLFTFHNPLEATMAQEKLKTNDIYAFIENENTVGLTPLGGVELKVFLKDKERAELILSEETIK